MVSNKKIFMGIKGAIQRLFHQSLVAIGPVVSEEKIFMGISHRVLC
jgi:hypothetical protein